jgi:hypothetical protein
MATAPPMQPMVHPSRKFWWSRHTSLYGNFLNLEVPRIMILYAPGKTVVIDGVHR